MGKQIPNNRNGNQTADNALLVFSEIEILRAPVTKEQCEYCCNKFVLIALCYTVNCFCRFPTKLLAILPVCPFRSGLTIFPHSLHL